MPDALSLVGPTGVLLLVFLRFIISDISCSRVLIVVWSLYSFYFLCSRRWCTDELGTLHADWTNVLCIPRQNQGRGMGPRKFDLSPSPPQYYFYWPFQGGVSAVVYYNCHCMSLYVCLGAYFILDSRLTIFGKKLSFWLSACSVLIVVPLL